MFTNSFKGIRCARKGSLAGFTLVETIVALALSTMIVVGMTQAFLFGIRHMQMVRSEARVAANATHLVQAVGREVQRAISISIEDIASSSVTLSGLGGSVEIDLDGHTVMFGDEPVTTSDVRVTSLEFTKVGESLRMEFTIEPLRPGRPFEGQITFTSLTGRLPS